MSDVILIDAPEYDTLAMMDKIGDIHLKGAQIAGGTQTNWASSVTTADHPLTVTTPGALVQGVATANTEVAHIDHGAAVTRWYFEIGGFTTNNKFYLWIKKSSDLVDIDNAAFDALGIRIKIAVGGTFQVNIDEMLGGSSVASTGYIAVGGDDMVGNAGKYRVLVAYDGTTVTVTSGKDSLSYTVSAPENYSANTYMGITYGNPPGASVTNELYQIRAW